MHRILEVEILTMQPRIPLEEINRVKNQLREFTDRVGICLLYSKGIIPVYLLVLFLLSGTLVSLIFRTFTFILKTILVLIAMGMLV